jgi:hypothetical protein
MYRFSSPIFAAGIAEMFRFRKPDWGLVADVLDSQSVELQDMERKMVANIRGDCDFRVSEDFVHHRCLAFPILGIVQDA